MHEHRGWLEFSAAERERKSQRNFRRFLAVWHHDEHLLLAHQHAAVRQDHQIADNVASRERPLGGPGGSQKVRTVADARW